MVKLYTKKGDKGMTVLSYEKRVKNDSVFDVLGDLDELNCKIGEIIASFNDGNKKKYNDELRDIQTRIMDLGSEISYQSKNYDKKITEKDVFIMENRIDLLEELNTELKSFILPGVNLSDSYAHSARAISRRVERSMYRYIDCELKKKHKEIEELDIIRIYKDKRYKEYKDHIDDKHQYILQYLNRLSDYFFALARNLSGCKERIKY